MRVSWTARRSNQSILKEINAQCSLEGLTLKLKLQYFGHLRQNADLLEKTDLGKDSRQEEKRVTGDKIVGWLLLLLLLLRRFSRVRLCETP